MYMLCLIHFKTIIILSNSPGTNWYYCKLLGETLPYTNIAQHEPKYIYRRAAENTVQNKAIICDA